MKAKHWKAHLILLSVAVNKVVSSTPIPLATTPRNTQPGLLLRRSNGALASVLRLRGADEPQQQPPPATNFWGQLRQRFISADSIPASSDPPSSTIVVDHGNRGSMSALVRTVVRALKNGLMHSGARVRSRGLLALLAVACVLSVVGATTNGVVSRPWGGWHRSTPILPVETSTDVADGDIGSTSTMGSNSRSERRRRLLKTPRFPLAHISWWKALQDRRKVSRTAGERIFKF